VTDCIKIQEEEPGAGNTYSNVAFKIHRSQVEQRVEKYIYHQLAHGEGMGEHQVPYSVLGNYTVLEEGMTFGVEPGLYDPAGSFGFNPSDNHLVTEKKGILMGVVPIPKGAGV
jgi:Xaa-Pro aminopeptidase